MVRVKIRHEHTADRAERIHDDYAAAICAVPKSAVQLVAGAVLKECSCQSNRFRFNLIDYPVIDDRYLACITLCLDRWVSPASSSLKYPSSP
jgi:hypothetical protein